MIIIFARSAMPKKKKGGKAVDADDVTLEEFAQLAVAEAPAPVAESKAAPAPAALDNRKMAEMMRMMEMNASKGPKKAHQFWNTQPVPQMGTAFL
jgi:hypothetical protein